MAFDCSKAAWGSDAPLQEFFFALEVGLGVVELRLRLLHACVGLVHLALQRSRIDFGKDVPELHLLAHGEADGLQLATDLEGEAADVRGLALAVTVIWRTLGKRRTRLSAVAATL